MADARLRPEIENFGLAALGEEWGLGFIDGIEMRVGVWEPLFETRVDARLFAPIYVAGRG